MVVVDESTAETYMRLMPSPCARSLLGDCHRWLTASRVAQVLGGEQLSCGCGEDRQGVVAGVGVDPNDERACMRDDGHGDRVSFLNGNMDRSLPAGAVLGGSHFGAAL